METIISALFTARDQAHRLHLRTRSFAQHVALKDLYDQLLASADDLTEIYQGKYGIMAFSTSSPVFNTEYSDAVEFIRTLASWAEATKTAIRPEDTFLHSEWDVLLSAIFRAKYKLENLT